MQMQGNVVLVTGGASGLGGATSKTVVEAGGKVLIADVNVQLGEALREGTRRKRALHQVRRHLRSRRQGRGRSGLRDGHAGRAGELRRHRHREQDGRQGRAAPRSTPSHA